MRYLIDDRDKTAETSLALYRTVLAWSANQAERFLLNIDPRVYEDSEDFKRLLALGQVDGATNRQRHGKKMDRMLDGWFARKEEIVLVSGIPSDELVRELTSKPAPQRAVAGDVCPAENVSLFLRDRVLYTCSDYGRDQILDLTEEGARGLREALRSAGLDPTSVITAPPYVVGSE